MKAENISDLDNSPGQNRLNKANKEGILRFLPPLPLFTLQPLLTHIVKSIAKKHPKLFLRLGNSANKTFLINPTNLPFFLILKPDPNNPTLKAHNRRDIIKHDVYIASSFATLLKMIDSKTDSDALFFNREIVVSGDSEAMVALRNALDDMDDSLASDVAASFGPLAPPIRKIFDLVNKA